MKTGDIILFFGDDGLIDREIEHYENSMFTHAAVVISGPKIVEAWWDGVRISTLGDRGPYAVFQTITPLKRSQQLDIELYARGRVGEHYNYPGLFGFLVKRWFGLKYNPFGSKDSVWCSQLVFEAYLSGGIHLL